MPTWLVFAGPVTYVNYVLTYFLMCVNNIFVYIVENHSYILVLSNTTILYNRNRLPTTNTVAFW